MTHLSLVPPCRLLSAVLFTLLIVAPPTLAEDTGEGVAGDPAQALRDLRSALENDPAVTPETRDALLKAFEALQAVQTSPGAPPEPAGETTAGDEATAPATVGPEGTEASPPEVVPPEKPIWEKVFERLAVYGDAQIRYDIDFFNGQLDNHRARIRLRLGANYQVFDGILIGARLITGPPNAPRTPHVDLGTGFTKLDISLDRAFISWQPTTPESLDGLIVTGGKFQHPFSTNPVFPELVWDYDVQPEGIYGEYGWRNVGSFEVLRLVVGEYVPISKAFSQKTLSTVAQAQGRVRLFKDFVSTLIVGYTYYTDPTPVGDGRLVALNNSNALVDTTGDGNPDTYVSEFGIINPILAFTWDGWIMPVTISGEYIFNHRANIDDDSGWAAGFSIGRTRQKGDWRVYYQYQEVEQDAVFSPYAQDTFYLASGYKGHVFGVNYQFIDKIGLHVWASAAKPDHKGVKVFGSSTDQWRMFVDLNVRF